MILEELSSCTGLSVGRIREIAEYAETYYRTYTIKKRSGGRRTICEPAEVLKRIQQALCMLVFFRYPVSKYCAAYERGCSPKANAERHAKSAHLLHMDIKNFFPAISFRHFYALLQKRYPEKDIDAMWKLVSYRGGLPIGAPSSPFLANRIAYRLDKKLAKAGRGMKFTRYADDLIFSRKRFIAPKLAEKVEKLLREEDFLVNGKKTRYMGSGTRRKVTGIVVTDDGRLSVGLAYRKRLKSDIFNFLTLHEGSAEELRGRIAWLTSVEPAYGARLREKYSRFQESKKLWN